MELYFELEFHGQTVPYHQAGYINLTRLERIVDARLETFLAAPEAQTRLLILGLCLEKGVTLTVQKKTGVTGPDTGAHPDSDGPSDLWAHHALVYEFLRWANENELADWLWEHCCELCWAEEIQSVPHALWKQCEDLLQTLAVIQRTTDVDLQPYEDRLGEVQQRIEAGECFKPDYENGDHFGMVTPDVLLEFTQIVGQLDPVLNREIR